MKLPSKHKIWLTFKNNDITYILSCPEYDRSVYTLFRVEREDDYIQLATGQDPQRLEEKVYQGKYR